VGSGEGLSGTGSCAPGNFLIFALVQIAFLSILYLTCVTFQCYMCNFSANAMIVIIALDRSCRENLLSNFCVAAWPICSSVTVTNVFQLGLPTHFNTMRLKVLTNGRPCDSE